MPENVGSSDGKVVVFIPVSAGAGADVGVCGGLVGANHGFTETGTVDAPVGGLAAVAHCEERLAEVGQIGDVVVVEVRLAPALVVAMGSIVGKTDARVKAGVSVFVGPTKEVVYLVVAMLGVIVVVHAVLDGRYTDVVAPIIIPASHEKYIV